MKSLLPIFLLFVFTTNCFAQTNLVKNPGFEDYHICPGAFSFVSDAYYWSAIIDTDYYVDSTYAYSFGFDSGEIIKKDANCIPYYLNKCDTCATTADGRCFNSSVPYGQYWYHYPRTGNAMMLSYFSAKYDNGQCSMYLQGRLYHSLEVGKTYCVTFYVVNTDYSGIGCNHIGAYFDDGTIDTSTECGRKKTEVSPQIISDSIITDTTNWTQIQGTFTATGTERFMTIGNFDSTTTAVLTFNIAGNPYEAAYLIDDVSVIAIDDTAYAGPDQITSIGGDSVWVGDSTGYLPCYWYSNAGGAWQLIDSNTAGFKVLPDTNTSYVMQLNVCGTVTKDTMNVWVFPTTVHIRRFENVRMYPNPATEAITIEGATDCDVSFTDLLGRVVLSTYVGNNKQIINTQNLARGTYFVKIADHVTGSAVVRKVVKE